MKVRVDAGRFAIVKSKEFLEAEFFAAVNYDGFTFVVKEEALEKMRCDEFEKGFRLLTFGVEMSFSIVGFLAKVTDSLAKAGIPVLVFSSYFTDHLLLKEEHLEKAVKALNALGFEVSS